MSEYVSKTLISNIQKELKHAFKDPEREQEKPASPKKVAAAIQRAFGRTDRELMAQVLPAFKLGFGALARCGSCALFTLIHEDYLHVANGMCLVIRAWVDNLVFGHRLTLILYAWMIS